MSGKHDGKLYRAAQSPRQYRVDGDRVMNFYPNYWSTWIDTQWSIEWFESLIAKGQIVEVNGED